MRIKELHIRNIASIVKADIDFENGLNDVVTGTPASIFLITGDTGSGKSILLDGIALALYKNTPRLVNVKNRKENKFLDADGKEVSVFGIEQYTRNGISHNDECYSEVVFDSNDGLECRAKLSLGMKKTRGKDGKLDYASVKWELKKGINDWENASGIEQLVGLTFDQFCRMVMLAQGQFEAFLTGEKKDREIILEKLTNTEHFTEYGNAIESLYKKAEDNYKTKKIEYEAEKVGSLEAEDIENKKQQYAELERQNKALNADLNALNQKLALIENIEKEQAKLAEQKEKLENVEGQMQSDEYRQACDLIAGWDATVEIRKQLDENQKAASALSAAKENADALRETYCKLLSDLEDRKQKLSECDDVIKQCVVWLEEHGSFASLYEKREEIKIKLEGFVNDKKELKDLGETLEKLHEEAKTIDARMQNADAEVAACAEKVEAKQKEIAYLTQKRQDLHPEKLNARKDFLQKVHNALEQLKASYERQAELSAKVNAQKEEISKNEDKYSKLEHDLNVKQQAYDRAQEENDKAKDLLSTMEMSVKDTLKTVRQKMYAEHATHCPLCGAEVLQQLGDEQFADMLVPIRKKQEDAKEQLEAAERQRDSAKDECSKLAGTIETQKKQLKELESEVVNNDKVIDSHKAKLPEEYLLHLPQNIDAKISETSAEMTVLQGKISEAEALQNSINLLLKEKTELDKKKSIADANKTSVFAEKTKNISDIGNKQEQQTNNAANLKEDKANLQVLIGQYYAEWDADLNATIEQFGVDSATYGVQKTKHEDAVEKYEKLKTLIETIADSNNGILSAFGIWSALTVEAKAFESEDINNEWVQLFGNVKTESDAIRSNQNVIDSTNQALQKYCEENHNTLDYLKALNAQESALESARKTKSETDKSLASCRELCKNSDGRIKELRAQLGLSEQGELPEKTALKEQADALNSQINECSESIGAIRTQIESHNAKAKELQKVKEQLDALAKVKEKWARLNKVLGGTRFRTLVQTYIMRPLLNNANIYLSQITDQYELTCSDENEQLSIFVIDHYCNNQVRSVTILSGGERFMVSLALSLALSSLNKQDMNVNILFIDEGFGTLDQTSLNSVMATLEKLQTIAGQSNRRVGIISHREELADRIPLKIKVTKSGLGRSDVTITRE